MIHFLYGPNNYVLKAEKRRLLNAFINEHGEHGVEVYEGEALAPTELRQLLHAGSLFTPNRLVILNQPAVQKSVWEALGEELADVPDSTDVIIVEPAADKRTRTFKALQQTARIVEGREFDGPKLVGWAINEAKQSGAVLDRRTAAYLVSRVGSDQSRLHNELKKLSLYKNIDKSLIDSLVEATPQSTVFELLDAVLAKRPGRAAELIEELKSTEDPYKTFGLISSQVHTLVLLISGRASAKTSQQIASDSGMHPFVIRKTESLARSTNWSEARRMIETLAELDDKLKRSGSDPWLLLESALMRIANR